MESYLRIVSSIITHLWPGMSHKIYRISQTVGTSVSVQSSGGRSGVRLFVIFWFKRNAGKRLRGASFKTPVPIFAHTFSQNFGTPAVTSRAIKKLMNSFLVTCNWAIASSVPAPIGVPPARLRHQPGCARLVRRPTSRDQLDPPLRESSCQINELCVVTPFVCANCVRVYRYTIERAYARAYTYMYMRMLLYPREFVFVYMHKRKRSFLRAFACVSLRGVN